MKKLGNILMNTDFTCNFKDTPNEDEILKWLKENLNEERYIHTIGVKEAAIELAERYGLDPKKAALAGLLHDCAKCLSNENLREIIDEKCKDVGRDELLNYKTYHAPVGVIFTKEIFKIDDPEILSAIRFHTLGRVDMTTFEKIIFLADKIEAKTRDEKYREKLLNILYKYDEIKKGLGLDMALFECFCATVKSLVDRRLSICPATIDVYNFLLQKVKNYLE